jgi:hypothetical protein
MKKIFTLIFLIPFFALAQNVGVGTPTPIERLDVNGNINVNGTIKVNGVDGNAGQVFNEKQYGHIGVG